MIQANIRKRSSRFPSHQIPCIACCRITYVNVPGAACLQIEGNAFSTCLFKCSDYLQHAIAASGPEIDCEIVLLLQLLKRGNMSISQVHDVHVVTYARSIGRVVVATPNLQAFAAPDRHLSDKRNQIVRRAVGVFSNQAARVGSRWIEIAQDRYAPARIARTLVAKHIFYDQLCAPVWIDWEQWMIFRNRKGYRFSVDCS